MLPALSAPSRRESLSARRAWIEIPVVVSGGSGNSVALRKESVDRNQTRYALLQALQSLSARRAWIEISGVSPPVELWKTSLSARRAWIEMQGRQHTAHKRLWSLSARRAWIEIAVPSFTDFGDDVALRKESVDRNQCFQNHAARPKKVALRKESVDRNTTGPVLICTTLVALRKESVDRNATLCKRFSDTPVALRKESVDRNLTHSGHPLYIVVALRKESVDRNTEKTASSCLILCRSPQGERG